MPDDLVQVLFQGGPNETADARALPLGSVISATNQVYSAEGTYQPRLGYTALSSAGPANILKLAVFNNELISVDGTSLWKLDSEAQTWAKGDAVPPMGVTHAPLQNATASYESYGSAVGYGYRVVAWNDTTTGPHAAIYSTTTGALVLNAVLANQGSESAATLAHINVGIINGYAMVLIAGASAIYYWQINLNPLGSSWQNGAAISDATYPAAGNTTIYCAAFLTDRLILAWEKITGSGSYISYIECQSFTISASSPSLITSSATEIGTFNGSSTYAHWFGVIAMAATGTSTAAPFWIAVATSNNTTGGRSGGSTSPTMTMAFNATTLAALSSNSPPVVPMGIGTYAVMRLTISFLPNSTTKVVVTANGSLNIGLNDVMGPSGAGLGPGMALQQFGENATASGVQTLYWIFAASQPVYVPSLGTHLMMLMQPTSGTMLGSYFLVDLLTNLSWSATNSAGPLPKLMKVLAPRIVGTPQDGFTNISDLNSVTAQFNSPPIVQGISSTQFEVTLPVSRTVGVIGLDLFTIDIGTTANYRWSPVALGRELYLSDGYYDGGSRFVENGYPYRPPSITLDGSSSGSLTYEYCYTFLRIDCQGNEEESAPSDFLQVSGASPSFTLNCACMTLSRRMLWSDNPEIIGTLGQSSTIYLCLYRTQALQNGDTLHYRTQMIPLSPNMLNPPNITNNVQAAYIQIADSAADDTISVNTVLYTDSGELNHNCPESFTHIAGHMERCYGIGADQRSVWFSQAYADGEVPNWNEAQIVTVATAGEPLIGLGSQYDRIYFFSKNKIFVLFGDGGSVTGVGSSFQLPAPRVQSPVGCIDPRSIVETPIGIAFQSTRGLELIDQSENVTFIGQPISVTTAAYPVCTSAIYCPNTSTIRFTMVNQDVIPAGSTTQGIIAVYDIRRQDVAAPGGVMGRWAVHKLTSGGQQGSLPWAPIEAACYHPVYGYVEGHNDTAGGSYAFINRECTTADPTPWLDYGTYFVPLSVTAAWAKANDLEGWGSIRRVRALCTYYAPHGLNASFQYDYVTSTSELHQFNSNVVAGFVNGSQEMVKYYPAQSQCAAICVTFATVAPILPQVVGTGQGAAFVGFSLEIHQRKGGWRRGGASAQS